MKTVNTYRKPGFTARERALGMAGAWTAFVVNEAYAVTSGLGYLSARSPTDPISDPYLSIMSLLIVLMAPFLVITMVAVHAYAALEHKPYSLAALAFMILLAGVTSTVNFALFVVARQPAPTPSLWAASFVSPGWPSLPQVLDFFAWDWFFALSMLCAAPVFRGSRLENAVRALMLLTTVLCILALIWLPFSPPQATIVGIIGWGVAGPIVFLLLANLFTRIQPDIEEKAKKPQE
jgi:hypothetical protein